MNENETNVEELNQSEFIKSPILVLNDDGTTSHFIALDYKPYDNFEYLEIYTEDRKQLINSYMFDGPNVEHLIKLERKYVKIELVYYILKKDEYGNSIKEEIDSIERSLFENVQSLGIKDVDVERFSNLLEKVKKIMDNPEGSPAEQAKHTERVRDSIVSEDARKWLFEKIKTIVASEKTIETSEIDFFTYKVFSMIYGLGILQELDDDEEVGEIMVNAVEFPRFHCDVYYIKRQRKYKYHKTFSSYIEMYSAFERVIEFSGEAMNRRTNALIEATRPNRDRVTIIIPEASDNYSLNIRKFKNFVPDKDNMRKSGTVNEPIEDIYDVIIRGKANIGIGGPMGTGKTTMINYMLGYTPADERKVVIASVSETDVDRVLKGHDVLILNAKEDTKYNFSTLVRVSLRTTADRVIIPESRGGEFKDLYEANLKTKGNMFTAHANDDDAFLDMCVDMYMASSNSSTESTVDIKNRICKALDVIIMMVRIFDAEKQEAHIRIQTISEVCVDEHNQYSHMNRIYEWEIDPEDPGKGQYRATGNVITEEFARRLNRFGVKRSEIDELNKSLIKESKLIPSLHETRASKSIEPDMV